MQLERALAILPVARRVAILAVEPELTIVMIRVAIDTTSADMTENRIFVAADTLRRSMPANQIKPGRGMLKFQRIAHLRPGLGRVAILAVPLKLPVGILHGRLAQDHASYHQQKQSRKKEESSHDRLLLSGMAAPWQDAQVVSSGLYFVYVPLSNAKRGWHLPHATLR